MASKRETSTVRQDAALKQVAPARPRALHASEFAADLAPQPVSLAFMTRSALHAGGDSEEDRPLTTLEQQVNALHSVLNDTFASVEALRLQAHPYLTSAPDEFDNPGARPEFAVPLIENLQTVHDRITHLYYLIEATRSRLVA